MRAVEVEGPGGEQWRVRVAWLPRWRWLARRIGGWRRKKKGGGGDFPTPDIVDVGGDEIGAAIALGIAIFIIGIAVFWWLLLPLLLLVIDLVIVLILLVVGLATRVALRRPWQVEAVRVGDGKRVVREVVGWRAAHRVRDRLAESLRRGPVAPRRVIATREGREGKKAHP